MVAAGDWFNLNIAGAEQRQVAHANSQSLLARPASAAVSSTKGKQ